MGGAFERMWSKLPEVLQSEDIKKMYIVIADIFDKIELEQEDYAYTNVISKLKNDMLDVYGNSYFVPRNQNDDATYRRKIQIADYKNSMIPTLNNFIEFTKNVTGYDVKAVEGWNLVPPKKGVLKVDITIPAGADNSLLYDLDGLYACGCRIDWIVKQESFTPFEIVGNHNATGLTNIYKRKERILV